MNWYFEQVLYKAPVCDFAVTKIQSDEKKIKFTVAQLGDMIMPTEILVEFTDGKEQLLQWNGKEKSKTYKYDKAVESVQIDPKTKF